MYDLVMGIVFAVCMFFSLLMFTMGDNEGYFANCQEEYFA
jgi:hypothetical protein